MKRPRRSRLRRRDERGVVAVVVAALVAFLVLPLAAISVDIGRIYVEIERVQNAADAAATAGVTFLPDDFASAKATAIAVAGRNGYPNSGGSSVEVAVGAKPTQLRVTVRHTIRNSFGAAFGAGYADVSRAAVADYNGPAPMGSPCNTFGNEPPGTVGARGPATSVIQVPPGGAVCTSNPQLWAAIAGPETPKGNGDQFSTRKCGDSSNSGCTGLVNNEYDPRGYFYLVRVSQAAVDAAVPITIQVFDPAFVESGDKCEKGPKVNPASLPLQANMNPFVPTDGTTRYAAGVTNFCTGDVLTTTTSEAPTTSFALRQPTDTYQPVQGVPITTCNKQFPGYLADKATTKALRRKQSDNATNNSDYEAPVAQVFRQWVDLCEFTPTKVGDHYLQVRTNVKLGGTADGQGGFNGNLAVFNQLGDDPTVLGSGSNRFALRVKNAVAGTVSVAGWDHMSIYANYSGATSTFNLVRVVPAAASKILRVTFYDVGDADDAGKIKVLPPINATGIGDPVANCTGTGVVTGTVSNCELTNVSSGNGWNGKTQTIRVPIPATYNCTVAEAGACWFRLQVAFPGGVSDTTTWSARIDGDPVRLIE